MRSPSPSDSAVASSPGSRSRLISRLLRGRTLLVLGGISLGWKLLLLGVGGTMVKLFIDDGLATVPAEFQQYGSEALEVARSLWAGPVERYGVRGVRLVSVERVADDHDAARCGGLTARVRAYTFFAIPYSEVRTVCDQGTVEYRVLPHHASGD